MQFSLLQNSPSFKGRHSIAVFPFFVKSFGCFVRCRIGKQGRNSKENSVFLPASAEWNCRITANEVDETRVVLKSDASVFRWNTTA